MILRLWNRNAWRIPLNVCQGGYSRASLALVSLTTRLRSETHWKLLLYLHFHSYFEATSPNCFNVFCKILLQSIFPARITNKNNNKSKNSKISRNNCEATSGHPNATLKHSWAARILYFALHGRKRNLSTRKRSTESVQWFGCNAVSQGKQILENAWEVLLLKLPFILKDAPIFDVGVLEAMFTLYQIAFATVQKLYRIRLLFTHKNGDCGAISRCNGPKLRRADLESGALDIGLVLCHTLV